MPASLLEAFSSPSIGGTESLHNPRYELDLDRNRGYGDRGPGPNPNPNQGYQGNQGSQGGLVPSPGLLGGSHNILGGSNQNGGCQGQNLSQSQGLSQCQGRDRDSTISLDNETKCDLHLYHILSCRTCREKLKSLLGCPTYTTPTPSRASSGLLGGADMSQLQVNQLLEGLLGMNINEKIKAAVQNNKPKEKVVEQKVPTNTSSGDNLIFYILIGFFLLYVLDLVLRRGKWF